MDRIAMFRAYARLVERQSFTLVARELGIQQSTVSKWLSGLESELGVSLIDRTTRSLRITAEGRRLYDHALSIVEAYDAAVSDMWAEDDAVRGTIRLGLPVVFGRLFVVPLLGRFARKHSEIQLDLQFSDRYVSVVDEGLDLAIRVGVPVDSSLRTHNLGETGRSVVASPGYLKSRGTPAQPKSLAGHECLIHTDQGPTTVWSFSRSGRTHRVTVGGRVRANNSEATLALARSGHGVALLADWLVGPDVRAGRLLACLPDYRAPRAPIRALSPPGRHVSPRVRALIDHLRAGLHDVLR